jgi:hypothetical protein
MAADQNMNQFAQGRAVGDLDLAYFGYENVISCRYNPAGTGNLVAGESVMLFDGGASDVAGPPSVDKRAADHSSPIYGTVRRSLRKAEILPGETVEIAIAGAAMFQKASGAMNRGARVSPVLATPGSVAALGTNTPYGILLDKAASGDIVRVLIQADGYSVGSA